MRHLFLRTIALLIVVGGVAANAGARGPALEPLSIKSKSGTHTFEVELAVTDEQQRKGLMFRRQMPANAGMLFLYDNGSRVTMWMSNTYIPLDMLFIAADGRITHIVERTVPLSTELIGSNGPVRAVLELNGGTASRLGIEVGDVVRHQAFQ